MPAISSANNRIIPLSGHNPDQAAAISGTLLYSGSVNGVDISGGLMPLTTFYWVRKSASGFLDFFFQFYSNDSAGIVGYSAPFSVQWMYGPRVAITYADCVYNSLGAVSPSSFQYGPTATQFTFNFAAGIPAGALTKMFYIRTNATTFIAHGGKITTNANSAASPGEGGGWVNNLVLPAPNSALFTRS